MHRHVTYVTPKTYVLMTGTVLGSADGRVSALKPGGTRSEIDPIGNPEDRFSHDAAHIDLTIYFSILPYQSFDCFVLFRESIYTIMVIFSD